MMRTKPASSMGFLSVEPPAALIPALPLESPLLRPVLPAWRMQGSGVYPVLVAEALLSSQVLLVTRNSCVACSETSAGKEAQRSQRPGWTLKSFSQPPRKPPLSHRSWHLLPLFCHLSSDNSIRDHS